MISSLQHVGNSDEYKGSTSFGSRVILLSRSFTYMGFSSIWRSVLLSGLVDRLLGRFEGEGDACNCTGTDVVRVLKIGLGVASTSAGSNSSNSSPCLFRLGVSDVGGVFGSA